MINGLNKDLEEQQRILNEILEKNGKLMQVLKVLEEYALDNKIFQNYYVGAGCINQTVFNYLEGKKIDYGIKDIDIVYYDEDTSYEAEDVIIKELSEKLKEIDYLYDIKNQARVHIWYNKKYTLKKTPMLSVEDAISRWGATVTCVGVRLENGKLKVFAPYGLNDVFGEVIRPVKIEFSKEAYYERAKRWQNKWSNLKIIDW